MEEFDDVFCIITLPLFEIVILLFCLFSANSISYYCILLYLSTLISRVFSVLFNPQNYSVPVTLNFIILYTDCYKFLTFYMSFTTSKRFRVGVEFAVRCNQLLLVLKMDYKVERFVLGSTQKAKQI